MNNSDIVVSIWIIERAPAARRADDQIRRPEARISPFTTTLLHPATPYVLSLVV